ncbi:MAG TPA: hypothetical protein VFD28_04085 [Candidatus Eisenbacteria bacterium]|jgi:hypothetical protein|nr:hypothetical protein [Candidatus Eisenbacteria bacterium]
MNENYIDKNKNTKNKDYKKQIETREKPYTMEVNEESRVDLLEMLELFLCPNIRI